MPSAAARRTVEAPVRRAHWLQRTPRRRGAVERIGGARSRGLALRAFAPARHRVLWSDLADPHRRRTRDDRHRLVGAAAVEAADAHPVRLAAPQLPALVGRSHVLRASYGAQD